MIWSVLKKDRHFVYLLFMKGIMILSVKICIVFFLSLPLTGTAKPLRWSGYGTIEQVTRGTTEQAPEGRLTLKLNTDRRQKTKLKARLVASNLAMENNLEEIYLDHKISDKKRILLGIMKKRNGLQLILNGRRRLSFDRSIAYDTLKTQGYTGEDLGVSWQFGDKDNLYILRLGRNGSQDKYLLNSYQIDTEQYTGNISLLVENQRIQNGYQAQGVSNVGMLFYAESGHWLTELLCGIDGSYTEYSRIYLNSSKNYYLAGLTLGWGYPLVQNGSILQPYLILSRMLFERNLEQLDDQHQLKAGILYQESAVSIALEGVSQYTLTAGSSIGTTSDSLSLMMRFDFDK